MIDADDGRDPLQDTIVSLPPSRPLPPRPVRDPAEGFQAFTAALAVCRDCAATVPNLPVMLDQHRRWHGWLMGVEPE